MTYNFKQIEKKWQKKWEEGKVFEVSSKSKKPKYYVLDMFPYPSGAGLHIGHAFVFSLGDIYARFKRLQGFNVLYPIGYDALGLPAENAAIKVGEHPEEYNKKTMKNFMKQQKAMGWSYDWSRLIRTDKPDFYKWDQWIFLKMLEKGIAYQKESAVNWCRKCDTVLANEQVVNGKCWRHEDTDVEIKHLKQWFLKTTSYADELLDGLNKINWSERAKTMQRNWIGKSKGVNVSWKVKDNKNILKTFTTTVDTMYGVTFMVISPEHPLLNDLITSKKKKEVEKYLDKIKNKTELERTDLNKDKSGVFIGSYVINPINEDEVPIFVADYVLMNYGTGVVMGVPAHDQRDKDFAKKYKLSVKQVLELNGKGFVYDDVDKYNVKGVLINSGKFNKMSIIEGREAITKELEKLKMVERTIQFRLKDWGISRQRYWGTPIPIVYCDKCGVVAVPEKDLPVVLPKEVKFGKGNPLLTNENWINTKCPKCNGKARRETDTMDTFVNSSWYMWRYTDPRNDKVIFDKKKINYWAPVNQYIGGPEHITMHLIYARFYTKFLRDLGLLKFDEPALRYFTQGIVMGSDGEKMSKSRGNVVEPFDMINSFGADALRFCLVSISSADKSFNWDDKNMQSGFKLLLRIFDYFNNIKFGKNSEAVEILLNQTLKNVSGYLDNFEYRKATIEIRALFDLIEKEQVSKDVLKKFLQMLNPFCPHISEELWENLGNKNFISLSKWPEVDESKLKVQKKEIDLNVKIIGQIRGVLDKFKANKIYLYVMPFEIAKLDKKKISKELGKEVEIFSTADKKKYDPEGKSKKARPGLAGVYLE